LSVSEEESSECALIKWARQPVTLGHSFHTQRASRARHASVLLRASQGARRRSTVRRRCGCARALVSSFEHSQTCCATTKGGEKAETSGWGSLETHTLRVVLCTSFVVLCVWQTALVNRTIASTRESHQRAKKRFNGWFERRVWFTGQDH
jgi:hypothetical protein